MPDLFDNLRKCGAMHPSIFRAILRSQIGKDCPFPTIKAAADKFGVNPEQLRLFIRGKREAEPAILAAFGLIREVLYVPNKVDAMAPRIERGIDGGWYAVWPHGGDAWDHIDEFPGCSLAHFGNYENAICLTDSVKGGAE